MRLVIVEVLDVEANKKLKGVHHLLNMELVEEDMREQGVGTLNLSKVVVEDKVVVVEGTLCCVVVKGTPLRDVVG